ncbi:hypothetical protein [Fluviicola chungangensis]|uniref:Uncharacterized protein n=1 Tax=Fluviicola chungangensis TaxID=2597671 RepID=A0A556N2Y3_9FLAO|nr:hypothetical protein [Fluviicola chungangensis]TSJ46511.1 hypothetical protein FO442_04950 [Fluviicola chungangensis]
MIPSITPPTDNLYKFISLFGLTILLFSVYNFGITFDASAKTKMSIEDVKVDVQQALYKKSRQTNDSLRADKVSNHFRPGRIRQMEQDLLQIERFIESCKLDPDEEIKLSGNISKISVALDNLSLKKNGYIGFAIIGCVLMAFGFIKWHYKEQHLRDKMLKIEHAIKELEKLNLRYGKEEKNSTAELMAKIKNSEIN